MFANHKGEIPFVILLIPFLAGIGLALNIGNDVDNNIVFISFLCLSLSFIALNISYKKFNLYKYPYVGSALIYATLFSAGWLCTVHYNALNRADHFSQKTAQFLAVKITNEPSIKNGMVRFIGSVALTADNGNHYPASGKLLIAIKDSSAFKLNYGDELLIPAKYTEVDPPYNPAEFNYKQYLANQNIYQQAFLYPGQYVVMRHNQGNPIIAYSLQLRKNLVGKFNTHMYDSAAIAVASTMILGYKADLSDDVLQAYANTGTLHVLSVSGAHVAIVFLLLSWLLAPLNRWQQGKLIKTVLIIMLIWSYALLTGFSPAVNRAALMISLVILGNNFYRYINSLNLLAASAFALLLYDPYYLADVGFQLSYLAVGGLIALQPVLYGVLKIENKWLDKLWSLCSVSIAAQAITFPLSVYYFHQFPVYFLVSNLFILLPVIVIMYLGLIFLAFSALAGISPFLGYLLEKCIVFMNDGLALTVRLPYSSVDKLWISKLDYLLLYGIMILFFYFLFSRNKRFIQLSLALCVVLLVSVSWKKISTNNKTITFLNLKKQRAIVFKNGNTAVVLSDLQPSDKNYRYSVQPGLDSAKVEHVKIYPFTTDINLPYLKKSGNLIQFVNSKILIADKTQSTVELHRETEVDYVYVTQNPPLAFIKNKQNLNASLLVISADNSDRYIDTLKHYLAKASSNHYVLKRNKALNFIAN